MNRLKVLKSLPVAKIFIDDKGQTIVKNQVELMLLAEHVSDEYADIYTLDVYCEQPCFYSEYEGNDLDALYLIQGEMKIQFYHSKEDGDWTISFAPIPSTHKVRLAQTAFAPSVYNLN